MSEYEASGKNPESVAFEFSRSGVVCSGLTALTFVLLLMWFFFAADRLAATWDDAVPPLALRIGAVLGWFYAGQFLMRTLRASLRNQPAVVVTDGGITNRSFGGYEYMSWSDADSSHRGVLRERESLILTSRHKATLSVNLEALDPDAVDRLVSLVDTHLAQSGLGPE